MRGPQVVVVAPHGAGKSTLSDVLHCQNLVLDTDNVCDILGLPAELSVEDEMRVLNLCLASRPPLLVTNLTRFDDYRDCHILMYKWKDVHEAQRILFSSRGVWVPASWLQSWSVEAVELHSRLASRLYSHNIVSEIKTVSGHDFISMLMKDLKGVLNEETLCFLNRAYHTAVQRGDLKLR